MKKSAFVALFILGSLVAPAFQSAASADPRLDKVLANQEQILKELEEIKRELEIVKVRATLRG